MVIEESSYNIIFLFISQMKEGEKSILTPNRSEKIKLSWIFYEHFYKNAVKTSDAQGIKNDSDIHPNNKSHMQYYCGVKLIIITLTVKKGYKSISLATSQIIFFFRFLHIGWSIRHC